MVFDWLTTRFRWTSDYYTPDRLSKNTICILYDVFKLGDWIIIGTVPIGGLGTIVCGTHIVSLNSNSSGAGGSNVACQF